MTDLVTIISDERLAERGVEVLKRISVSRMPLADASFIAQWVHDARQSLRAQGGVRVKPLEWEQIGDNHWRADTAFGPWEVCAQPMFGKSWRTFSPTGWKTYHGDDPEELKRLSEQELSKRILSALEASPAPVSERDDLIDYLFQDDQHNRLVPRIVDIAYNAFMLAKQPNEEDEGPSDWFTDTKPKVDKMIAEVRAALTAALAAKGGQ